MVNGTKTALMFERILGICAFTYLIKQMMCSGRGSAAETALCCFFVVFSSSPLFCHHCCANRAASFKYTIYDSMSSLPECYQIRPSNSRSLLKACSPVVGLAMDDQSWQA